MRFIASGHYVPKQKVTNVELTDKPDWVEKKLGIKTRHKAAEGETTVDLGVQAATAALVDIHPDEIDLIIGVTSSPDVTAPSMACAIQDRLGLTNAHAFDLGAVCTGFVYALNVAHSMLHKYTNIMIVAAERYSKITDYDRRDNFFFGDGAGCVVVTNTHKETLFKHHMYSHGEFKDLFVTDSLKRFDTDQARWIIPHQPNISLLTDIANRCNISLDKFLLNIEDYGNIAGATIPATISRHIDKIDSGDIVIFTAVGAGMTGGTIMMEFHK
jgi:3-oxoacyl-[acyl-carrier-protein] synthase-3